MRSIDDNKKIGVGDAKISIWYLIFNFLKIGSTSFGGHMSLISVVQNQMVTKDKVIDNETVLDGISLASVLPGPFAVNVVVFIGYKLRGFWGGMLCLVAVMTPSFLLVYLLSFAYFNLQNTLAFDRIMYGILPAVCAIIFSVAFGITKKNVSGQIQIALLVLSCLALILFNSFLTIIASMIVGAVAGYVFFKEKENTQTNKIKQTENGNTEKSSRSVIAGIVAIVIGFLVFFCFQTASETALKLASVFGGMSLTLFGGGYVFIPIMQEIVVDTMGWMTTQEFVDGIAMGQVTPGPIMISSVFIGYKVLGFYGAVIAALSMFLPSGILTIVCSKFLLSHMSSNRLKAILKGVRAVAIGMIFAAVYKVGIGIDFTWQAGLISALSLILLMKYKMNAVYVIPISAVMGYLLFEL